MSDEQPPSTPQPPPSPSRRRCRRHVPKGSTKAICLKGSYGLGKNVALAVLDLSEEGIQLLISEPVEVGQEVEVNLENLNRPKPLKAFGKVRWSAPGDEGAWRIGVQFQRTLSYLEVVAFIRA